MTREIINIQDFTILVEQADSHKPLVDSCHFQEPMIAVAFYGEGDVNLSVNFNEKALVFDHTKGLALSFYADDQVEFVHTVSAGKPLECVVIATAVRNLQSLPELEVELFREFLNELIHPRENFVKGPSFFMAPEMQSVVNQVFRIRYSGKAKMMFFRSQITALLSHYFGQLSLIQEESIPEKERQKLMLARQILSENLESPPSLSELARRIGLNTFKLKKNFKELFGLPVFKYLQTERLNKAHDLIRHQGVSVQEAAWDVGYDSLSSFSNAFVKKFGFRPSEVKQ